MTATRPATRAQRDELFKARLELRHQLALERAKASVAARQAQADHDLAASAAAAESLRRRIEAEEAADRASSAAYCGAVIEVAKGGLDRVRGSAEFVQKAAAAVFALYTGALTVSFSVTAERLPSRGILPSVFLGLAIVLATAYLAFLTRGPVVSHPRPAEGRAQAELNRASAYVHWINTSRLERAWMLQSSVVALALGVLVLPAPFVSLPSVAPASAVVAACPAPLVADDLGTGACVPPWPDPPPAGDLELRKARYAAQLAEVGTARQEARASVVATRSAGGAAEGSDVGVLLAALGLGLLLVSLPAIAHPRRAMARSA